MQPRFLFALLLLLAVTNLYSQVRLKDYSTKVNDTCWRVDYYIPSGPLAKIESYRDRKRTIPHGRFAFYNEQGSADSAGFLANGLRNGTWYYFNDKGKVYLSIEYSMGNMVSEKKYEVESKAKKEPLKEGEKESEFEGGPAGWQRYLNRNLRYPREAIVARIQGEVRIAFYVDTLGAVNDVWVFKSVERSLDQESARMMIESPQWIPAVQDGRPVKSYKIQPIRFRLQQQ